VSDQLPQIPARRRILQVHAETQHARRVLKALASEPRLRVLELLSDQVLNVSEIAEALDIPLSTATLHVTTLEEAGLVNTELQPATRGRQKVCARAHDIIMVELTRGLAPTGKLVEFSMPIGAYVDCSVIPTCGLASDGGIIGLFDDQASFYEPGRFQAQLLWFRHGYVEYRFPNRLPATAILDSLDFSMEVGSEAPLHHPNWPSDVTLWINSVEIGTWTSPADFGGQRGILTPEWWEGWNSQYGLLKVWQVNAEGTFVDGLKISAITLDELRVLADPYISLRIGVKDNARHVGGINIFGSHFGNYPQDLVLRCQYH
jgi:predicted transcriptional regulator